jgi:sugar lactone lactonase YvrE
VADTNNHRVLRFDSGSGNASGVLGQGNFTDNASATTQNGMFNPQSVFVDAAGRLWVADTANHRVLRFDGAAAKANGANADGVLGQPNLTSGGAGMDQKGMVQPRGVAGDAAGRLYVADTNNNRVLWFDNAGVKADADGAYADGVLGQPGFNSIDPNNPSIGGLSERSLAGPMGLFWMGDPASGGVLWVTDSGNHRVLRYGNPLFVFLPLVVR